MSATQTMTEPGQVTLRDFPPPYRALVAICSDLDNTPSARVYAEIMRFLNTRATTAMGAGVGLEVGNSIYFDMPPDEFAYWNTDDAGREMVRRLIRSGHIDVLHSFGDLAHTRASAGRALEELERHGCHVPVWVDHRVAPSNFGADIMCGRGDVPSDPCYHADLTRAHGVRFVWRGRVTSVIGQDAPHSLGSIWRSQAPLRSTRTVAKEAAKHLLARAGHPKYVMHADNTVMRPVALRDGSQTMEFIRCNPHWAGVENGDTARGLADSLSEHVLDRLERRRAASILYTHLGKQSDPARPFDEPTCARLRALGHRADARRVLVTTTYRLLRYLAVRRGLRYHSEPLNGKTVVYIEGVADAVRGPYTPTLDELQGVTFASAGATRIEVRLASGAPLPTDQTRHHGSVCATIPWRPLTFPDLDI